MNTRLISNYTTVELTPKPLQYHRLNRNMIAQNYHSWDKVEVLSGNGIHQQNPNGTKNT